MSEAVAISTESKPHLPRGMHLKHDATRDEWLLMAPERVLKLNPVAVEILKRCDGKANWGNHRSARRRFRGGEGADRN